jgi:hypothetical protein
LNDPKFGRQCLDIAAGESSINLAALSAERLITDSTNRLGGPNKADVPGNFEKKTASLALLRKNLRVSHL